MVDQRSHFHSELAALEQTLLDVADRCERMVGLAVEALTTGDTDLCEEVFVADKAIDATYLDTHNRWLSMMARQQPMGGDLRLMSALLHVNVTLERMGDQCVNIANLARLSAGLPARDRIIEQIREMADLVRPMIRTAAEALVRRDADEARLLPAMDEPIDRINRLMYREVVDCAPDTRMLEWATHMMMAARALERIGDQSVDIGEQVAFLVTGEFQEFSEKGFVARASAD
ncbi:MAG: phosphate signaling complex protein PhoU [Acidimicrobiia bacterium]|nr:phosphate signaling complex protein PhoU [Acidimicrobiia bacterium]MDH4307870.1 phosphate signaling complex protein PhoU [Acidimicrobiia bacterium]MDH5292741.1 phosphate signaling complex protein PhoU [Acidimicrobiia bacterium]